MTYKGFCLDCQWDQELNPRGGQCKVCGSSSILIRGAVLDQIIHLMERDFPEEKDKR